MLSCVTSSSFLLLNSISCVDIPQFVYPFILFSDSCIFSHILAAMTEHECSNLFVDGYLFSFFLGKCLGMELLGHGVNVYFVRSCQSVL